MSRVYLTKCITILLVFAFANSLFACDMIGVISRAGRRMAYVPTITGTYNDPNDYFTFLRNRTSSNPTGYGLICYKNGSLTVDPLNRWNWYGGTPSQNLTNFDAAVSYFNSSSNEVSIVLAHDRYATSTTYGTHPFYLDWNGRTYTFEHNGNTGAIIAGLREKIMLNDPNWFTNHPSNWSGSSTSSSGWIDSEMLFHYIMSFVALHDGDVQKGIYEALNSTYSSANTGNKTIKENYMGTNNATLRVINFIMSDGETLYAFKNALSSDASHKLNFFEMNNQFPASAGIQFAGFRTQPYVNAQTERELDQFELAWVSRYGYAQRVTNFLHPTNYTQYDCQFVNSFPPSGAINSTNQRTYITKEFTVPAGNALSITGEVRFAKHMTLNVAGNMYLENNAKLYLTQASNVLVSGQTAGLYMKTGSKIYGDIATTYSETLPGYPVGAEVPVPGDRILTTNGGVFSAYSDANGIHTGTNLASTNTARSWDGIYIEDPRASTEYKFKDSTWEGFQDVDMYGVTTPNAILRMDNVVLKNIATTVEDGHKLAINVGYQPAVPTLIEAKTCSPFMIMGGKADINYCNITKTGTDATNLTGIYASYVNSEAIKVNNCSIQNFTGNGVTNYDNRLWFNNNNVSNNGGYGIYLLGNGNFDTDQFGVDQFRANIVSNNLSAEMIGKYSTYSWRDCGNTITDLASNGGYDQYGLMALSWNSTMPLIDLTGNTINPTSASRNYPNGAFIFDQLPIRNMLLEIETFIAQEDYESAKAECFEIIAGEYDNDLKGDAAYMLYLVECFSTKDFGTLRDYLANINYEDQDAFYEKTKDIIIKSLMQEKSYDEALVYLDMIIQNPYDLEALNKALIDQAYCLFAKSEKEEKSAVTVMNMRSSKMNQLTKAINNSLNSMYFGNTPTTQSNASPSCEIGFVTSYPNPFSNSTTIALDLKAGTNTLIEIFNIRGQKITTLNNKVLDKGTHQVVWSGLDNFGKKVGTGMYFCRIKTDRSVKTHKLVVLK